MIVSTLYLIKFGYWFTFFNYYCWLFSSFFFSERLIVICLVPERIEGKSRDEISKSYAASNSCFGVWEFNRSAGSDCIRLSQMKVLSINLVLFDENLVFMKKEILGFC